MYHFSVIKLLSIPSVVKATCKGTLSCRVEGSINDNDHFGGQFDKCTKIYFKKYSFNLIIVLQEIFLKKII